MFFGFIGLLDFLKLSLFSCFSVLIKLSLGSLDFSFCKSFSALVFLLGLSFGFYLSLLGIYIRNVVTLAFIIIYVYGFFLRCMSFSSLSVLDFLKLSLFGCISVLIRLSLGSLDFFFCKSFSALVFLSGASFSTLVFLSGVSFSSYISL